MKRNSDRRTAQIAVFLRGGLDLFDEYRESDPYQMNPDEPFHKRRVDLTLELIKYILATEEERLLRVLDIGCGKGYITEKIHDLDSRLEVTGCDSSFSAIQYASKNIKKPIEFDVVDINQMPYAKEYFDIIVLNNVYEHIPNMIGLLSKDIYSILKSNGYIIISTPSRYRMDNIINVLQGRNMQLMSDMHVTEYSIGQIVECLRFCGFEELKIITSTLIDASLKRRVFKNILIFFTKKFINPINWENTIFYLFKKQEVIQ